MANAYNTNLNSFGAGNTIAVYTTLADQSQNQIVPEVDSKLEINYNIPINGNGSSVSIAAGYLLTVYINGINQVVPSTLVPGAFNGGTIAIESSEQVQSNLDLNGRGLEVLKVGSRIILDPKSLMGRHNTLIIEESNFSSC